jgi:iron(III) transport system substrate-binding protein
VASDAVRSKASVEAAVDAPAGDGRPEARLRAPARLAVAVAARRAAARAPARRRCRKGVDDTGMTGSVGRMLQIVDNLQKSVDTEKTRCVDWLGRTRSAVPHQSHPIRRAGSDQKGPKRTTARNPQGGNPMTIRLTAPAAGFILALAALLGAAPAAAQKTQLNVYTALETDQIKAYKDAFERANPGVEIVWTRDSTGVITAKLLAEKANPKADVVMGVAATSMAIFANEGMLEPYAPKGLARIAAQYRDPKNPPAWVGMDVWGATVCFNYVEAAKRNVPRPESWKDLLNPVYKGQIVMPHPASSGTGFFNITAWLQMFGEKAGWDYMDGLHQNIATYMHSGSRPCAAAARGEYLMGISFEYRANREKAQGAPIGLIFPKEGLGWDLEAIGIHKGTSKTDAAKKLLDWSISDEAMALYAKNFAIVAVPGLSQPLPNVPNDYAQRLVKNDFAWAAKNRDRILAEWGKRYESKAAPK